MYEGIKLLYKYDTDLFQMLHVFNSIIYIGKNAKARFYQCRHQAGLEMRTGGAMQVLNFLFSLTHGAHEKEAAFIKTLSSWEL